MGTENQPVSINSHRNTKEVFLKSIQTKWNTEPISHQHTMFTDQIEIANEFGCKWVKRGRLKTLAHVEHFLLWNPMGLTHVLHSSKVFGELPLGFPPTSFCSHANPLTRLHTDGYCSSDLRLTLRKSLSTPRCPKTIQKALEGVRDQARIWIRVRSFGNSMSSPKKSFS